MTFSPDPEVKGKLKKITAPTKPVCYEKLKNQIPEARQGRFPKSLPKPILSHIRSPILVSSPINRKRNLANTTWKVNCDAYLIDTHLQ